MLPPAVLLNRKRKALCLTHQPIRTNIASGFPRRVWRMRQRQSPEIRCFRQISFVFIDRQHQTYSVAFDQFRDFFGRNFFGANDPGGTFDCRHEEWKRSRDPIQLREADEDVILCNSWILRSLQHHSRVGQTHFLGDTGRSGRAHDEGQVIGYIFDLRWSERKSFFTPAQCNSFNTDMNSLSKPFSINKSSTGQAPSTTPPNV